MDMEKITAETEQILLEKYDSYYRLAYSYMQNKEDALDVVQESAYRAIRDCSKIKNPAFLSTWIYRIVVNTALDLLRKRTRERKPETFPEEGVPDTYEDLDLKELLAALDDKSRTILLLRYFEDMRLEDIAALMGENVNTVKARLYRTLKKLRLELEPETEKKGALL